MTFDFAFADQILPTLVDGARITFIATVCGMALALIPFFGLGLAGLWTLALLYCGAKQVYGFSARGSLGALAIFLSLQAALGMIWLLGLAVLACLGFLLLLLLG